MPEGLTSTEGLTPTGGLTSVEAARLLAQLGPNRPPEHRGRSLPRRLAAALAEPLVVVLLVAAVLTALTRDWSDLAVIVLVVTVNTSLGLAQELRAEGAVRALARLSTPTARVVRDGREAMVDADTLVPGDLLVITEGDGVAADGRVVEAAALALDESLVTGEAQPVDRGVGETVLAGTVTTHGRARVVVTATGAASQLGRVSGQLAVRERPTPLQRRMTQLSRVLATVVVLLCLVVLALGLWRGQPLELMLLTAISLAVAAVPESLPVVVTMTLTLATRRMARRHAVVRSLSAAETLGSVTLLATDKTGTLTHGRMAVTQLVCAPDVTRADLLGAAVLCNDAQLDQPGGVTHLGDPTEVALLQAARAAGLDVDGVRRAAPRTAEHPFDSAT
ncbi:MAG: ATPase, partial [Friedmanniella sp.]|nr:ATPase [Friedmanniella sp.]